MADIVLFRCHELGPQSLHLYRKLRQELPDIEIVAVGYVDAPPAAPTDVTAAFYDRPKLEMLPYPVKLAIAQWADTTGHNDLPVLQFFRSNPGYANYWIIEYDVFYTGNWRNLFRELASSTADLLATNIFDFHTFPDWFWWKSIATPGMELEAAQKVKAFLPFARASARFLAEIDRCYREGWAGHYEAIWPISARLAGMVLEDVGGNTSYTPEARRFRHYSSNAKHWSMFPGTFQYRPSYNFGDLVKFGPRLTPQPMLWHPVK